MPSPPRGSVPLYPGAGIISSNAFELSDGRVFDFPLKSFVCGSNCLDAGQVVKVCSIQSKLSGRIYYRLNGVSMYRKL